MDKWLKTGTLKRSASRTEIRTTDLAAMGITVDQKDDNHEEQRPTDCPVQVGIDKIQSVLYTTETRQPETELPPPCRSVRDQLNNDRCNSSDTEVGFLIAITGQGLTSSEGGTGGSSSEWGKSNHSIIIPIREARARLLIRRLLIHLLVVPGGRRQGKEFTGFSDSQLWRLI
ncbi:hypothetical protein AVEN_23622-1 [Araneus ventricosus]|uniref:Uncharacterized protein n=1 Tax=Araneus ventricosus TaxID=182803 RepID=A0A4Y2BIZ7_ARAVE|nr:hypothetical protein AVEN_23622-1 [Araneus ventricosus]